MAETNKTLEENVKAAGYEESQEERLAAGGGAPTSPQDAAGMGASPDQAKMVGVPKPTSLEMAFQQAQAARDVPQELQYEALMREKHYEDAQKTEAQIAAENLAENLEGMGSFDNIVQQAATQALTDATEGAGEIQTSMDLIAGAMDDPADQATLETAVANYISTLNTIDDPNTPDVDERAEAIAKAGTQLDADTEGLDISTTELFTQLRTAADVSPEQITDNFYQGIADGTVDVDELTFDHIVSEGLLTMEDGGYKELDGLTPDELTAILGDEFGSMTVAEISKAVSTTVSKNFHTQANIQKTLSDPNISPVLAEALQGKVKQIEASGAAAIEADAESAARDVMSAGVVLFNGEVVELETLLSDDFITTTMQAEFTDFLDMSPEDRKNSDLWENNPEFANVLGTVFDKAMDAGEEFEETIKGIEKANADYGKAVDETAAAIKESSGVDVPSFLKPYLGMETDGLNLGAYEPSHFATLATDNPSVMQAMAGWGEDGAERFFEWEKTATPAQLEAVSKALKNPMQAASLSDLLNMTEKLKGISSTAPADQQYRSLMELAFGMGANGIENGVAKATLLNDPRFTDGITGEFLPNKLLQQLRADAAGGDNKMKAALKFAQSIFDVNGDGNIDTPDEIRKRLAGMGSGDMSKLLSISSGMRTNRDIISAGPPINSASELETGAHPADVRVFAADAVTVDGKGKTSFDIDKLSKKIGMTDDVSINQGVKDLTGVLEMYPNMSEESWNAINDKIFELQEEVRARNPEKAAAEEEDIVGSLSLMFSARDTKGKPYIVPGEIYKSFSSFKDKLDNASYLSPERKNEILAEQIKKLEDHMNSMPKYRRKENKRYLSTLAEYKWKYKVSEDHRKPYKPIHNPDWNATGTGPIKRKYKGNPFKNLFR